MFLKKKKNLFIYSNIQCVHNLECSPSLKIKAFPPRFDFFLKRNKTLILMVLHSLFLSQLLYFINSHHLV